MLKSQDQRLTDRWARDTLSAVGMELPPVEARVIPRDSGLRIPQLFLLGLNHRTAPIELRERFTIPIRDLPTALQTLRQSPSIDEAAILSTCNRTELYIASADPSTAHRDLVDFLGYHSRLEPKQFISHLYAKQGAEVAAHLFSVAAGLDSIILGESEITSQVKEAHHIAQTQGTVGPLLHRLLQKALHAAKEVRTRTTIGQGDASIGSVAVRLARELFADRLTTCEILLWGAGKAAEATARHLMKSGIRQLWIVNRTQPKAQDLAALCQGGWLSWEQALRHLGHVDIAIVCTQAPHYVIDRSDMDAVREQRGGRPLYLIDLAVPRNVDPVLKHHPGVVLYDIDDLQAEACSGLDGRRAEVARSLALIEAQVGHFLRRSIRTPHPEPQACPALTVAS